MDAKQPVILVVEDDDDIRELVAFSLEEEGYRVEQAADGIRGQEMAEELCPDLIVLDLIPEQLAACLHTFVADINTRACNQPASLVFPSAAEAAANRLFVFS